MSTVWNAATYDSERRRLIYCFDEFYGTVGELVARFCPASANILDLGAGTGLLSAAVVHRLPHARLHLLDASPDMLAQAANRFEKWHPRITVGSLRDALPAGPFDAVISALAIHHLDNAGKRDLYRRILDALTPGGLFINAEQVASPSKRVQQLIEAVHLDRARALGSTPAEIDAAVQRMTHDQCAGVTDQLDWLNETGFEDVECLYRSFRFAVLCGWKPASLSLQDILA